MSSSYLGTPTAVQSPSAAPGPGVAPTVVLPSDGDPDNAAAFAQAYKTLADFEAWTQNFLVSADFVSLKEDWIGKNTGILTSANPVANFLQWAISSSGANVGAAMGGLSALSNGYYGPGVTLNLGTTNVSYTSFATAGQLLYLPLSNPTGIFIETVIEPSVSGIWQFAFGLSTTQTPLKSGASDLNFMITASNAAANYQAQTQNGASTTSANTGVAWANNTPAKVRMVYTPTAVAFYINGTLVATNTTNIPVFAGSGASFYVAGTAASGDTTATRAFSVGRVTAIVTR